ncbi:MAG: hypothetical protein P8N60_11380, partial [Burkholderiaceae bacterium]|nr:hypothetical protein [Burkholderiaceae bacterium]
NRALGVQFIVLNVETTSCEKSFQDIGVCVIQNSNFIGCPTVPFLPIATCRHGIGYSRNAAILVLEIYDLLAP